MSDIYAEIRAERQRQDLQWGGPEHDDSHYPFAWFGFIDDQEEKVWRDFGGQDETAYIAPFCRARLVKIAALAVAGIESIDRQQGEGRDD